MWSLSAACIKIHQHSDKQPQQASISSSNAQGVRWSTGRWPRLLGFPDQEGRGGGSGKFSKTLCTCTRHSDVLSAQRRHKSSSTLDGSRGVFGFRPALAEFRTRYGIMTSAEEDEEFDEAVERYASDTTWSWVQWFESHLHVWWIKAVEIG